MGVTRLLKKVLPQQRRDRKEIIASLDDRSFYRAKHQCPSCSAHIEEEELAAHLFVCPQCGYHFRISGPERIKMLLDGGSFVELASEVLSGNPIAFPGYEDKLLTAEDKSRVDEAVTVGYGMIQQRPVAIAAMSFHYMGGSMGSVVGERIARCLMHAVERKTPAIICTASGGARMQEGIYSLMQMAKTSHMLALMAKEGLPVFVVLTDPTTGGVTASFAMLGDVIIAEPKALIGFAGPRVIEGTIKQKLPEGFQRAEFLVEKGFVDCVVPRKSLRETLIFLIDTHQKGGRGKS
ncbi:acetyl-CoA carboxylase, carboxyltransferase subunit beta [Spirochaeta africana]|uniref:Acetyl-coenzyme A carboxylase carboxyl transferase subunit beta n=1 Tax=Spirochaeta africana (strain ATCC 700263 / DSM 8902 / Z-7692) TaxID=889378 RepID=H9UL55_SPIAZ|nr:acetyl-CoA carboxylase, carboxyltransferase subunit beta [Spirochaeta africana]AFG38248.1 acetyl-CoA carboxylase, carboxyl transferase, beta subunit [Spirochaeta africana DSM 8902]